MRLKGSYTVEAALVCPFLCLVICAMLSFTLSLYHDTKQYAETAAQEVGKSCRNADTVRVLRVVCELTE